jgi:hypothetical protein
MAAGSKLLKEENYKSGTGVTFNRNAMVIQFPENMIINSNASKEDETMKMLVLFYVLSVTEQPKFIIQETLSLTHPVVQRFSDMFFLPSFIRHVINKGSPVLYH